MTQHGLWGHILHFKHWQLWLVTSSYRWKMLNLQGFLCPWTLRFQIGHISFHSHSRCKLDVGLYICQIGDFAVMRPHKSNLSLSYYSKQDQPVDLVLHRYTAFDFQSSVWSLLNPGQKLIRDLQTCMSDFFKSGISGRTWSSGTGRSCEPLSVLSQKTTPLLVCELFLQRGKVTDFSTY